MCPGRFIIPCGQVCCQRHNSLALPPAPAGHVSIGSPLSIRIPQGLQVQRDLIAAPRDSGRIAVHGKPSVAVPVPVHDPRRLGRIFVERAAAGIVRAVAAIFVHYGIRAVRGSRSCHIRCTRNSWNTRSRMFPRKFRPRQRSAAGLTGRQSLSLRHRRETTRAQTISSGSSWTIPPFILCLTHISYFP